MPLTLERVQLLNHIGFEWSAKDPTHKSWEGRYEELCEFVVSSITLYDNHSEKLPSWMSLVTRRHGVLTQK